MKIFKGLFLLLFVLCELNCQNFHVDTIFIKQNCNYSIREIGMYKLCYVLRNNEILFSKKKNDKSKCDDSLFCFINNNYTSHFIFVDKKNRYIEEGNWRSIQFNGKYRSYFKNGKIKSEGNYCFNVEIGRWVYYKKNGQVYKSINYPNSIIGEYDRDQAKIDIETQLSLYKYDFVTLQDSINFVKSVKGRWLRRYR